MPESIQEHNGKYRWPLFNILEDLVNQWGLNEEDLGVSNEFELFYKNNPLIVDHDYKFGLKIASPKYSEELINAFSKILDLKPFCKYKTNNSPEWIVYEWHKTNPMMRYFDLMEKEGIEGLEEL